MMQSAACTSNMARVAACRAYPATILVVDDDPDIQNLVKRSLEDHGHHIVTAGTGAEALDISAENVFDLAIIDLRLPDIDGMVLVRQFSTRLNLPVLVLSGLGETAQRIRGLEEGADDYVAKPFEPNELAARVEASLRARRQSAQKHFATAQPRLRVDDWIIDMKRQTIYDRKKNAIHLSNAEHKLLEALLEHPNKVLSRSDILAMTHDGDQATERSVDIQVTRLRKKLERDSGHLQLIRTVRRLGYMLVADSITSLDTDD